MVEFAGFKDPVPVRLLLELDREPLWVVVSDHPLRACGGRNTNEMLRRLGYLP